MNQAASNLAAFYLIGDRSALPVEETGRKHLRPALFADYRDLSKLRYDFPLILAGENKNHEWVRSLADAIDATLQDIVPQGIEGEETRRQALSLEQEIRILVARGQRGALSLFWERATNKLLFELNDAEAGTLRDNLTRVRSGLGFDGEIIDCDKQLPARFIRHAWHQEQRAKAMQLGTRIDYLVRKLSDILRADYIRSPKARDAVHLKGSLGAGDQDVFDFQAMARILESAPVGQPLSAKRLRRIRKTISELESQDFVVASGAETRYRFTFGDCSEALAVFRERLPEMVNVVRAISIAELEIDNRYDAPQHDSFYNHFGENQLGPKDLALFPSYLVCLQDGDDAANSQALFDILRAGLPFKIVVQADNLVGDPSITSGQLSLGTRGQQLATMAMGLNNVFVLQAAASSLYRLRDQVMHGLASDRPALFSVYSGIHGRSPAADTDLPPYLLAAAATESRAFPCFIYDPVSGNDLASRFHLDGNPLVEHDWCRHTLQYEDAQHHSYTEETAFTLVDFIACEGRFADHFACVPKSKWDSDMLPVDAFLQLESQARTGKVPYVLLIDEDDVLHRAICDDRLIDAATRSLGWWSNLQELGGINNSHVLQALARARETWEVEKGQLNTEVSAGPIAVAATAEKTPTTEPQQTPPAPTPAVEAPSNETPGVSSDDPWIETIRCTTCNECTQLNDRMFAYDEDQRAFIADPDAGTFRELVEAAETCQVAIIHPGKPRNPAEPGLEQLVERAEPFNVSA